MANTAWVVLNCLAGQHDADICLQQGRRDAGRDGGRGSRQAHGNGGALRVDSVAAHPIMKRGQIVRHEQRPRDAKARLLLKAHCGLRARMRVFGSTHWLQLKIAAGSVRFVTVLGRALPAPRAQQRRQAFMDCSRIARSCAISVSICWRAVCSSSSSFSSVRTCVDVICAVVVGLAVRLWYYATLTHPVRTAGWALAQGSRAHAQGSGGWAPG